MNYPELPQNDLLLTLHRRLLAGDPIASERVVAKALPSVVRIVARRHSGTPSEVIEDAAIDSLLSYFREPQHFDPGKGTLITYLATIADFRVRDRQRGRQRRNARELSVGGSVELALFESRAYREDGPRLHAPAGAHERLSREMEKLVSELLPDLRDQKLLFLIADGRTEIDEYAAVLGLSELPQMERRVQVKRHRDRVLKRLQRRRNAFDLARGICDGG